MSADRQEIAPLRAYIQSSTRDAGSGPLNREAYVALDALAARLAAYERTAIVSEESRVRIMATPCHVWTGWATDRGYGSLRQGADKRKTLAHRSFYEQAHGAVPEGLVLHHECENKLCVNPEHLKLVTIAEHNRLHPDKAARVYEERRARTHCKHGHEYTPENTVRRPDRGRICLTCKRQEYLRRKARASTE